MNDHHLASTHRVEHALARRDDRLQGGYVVAERFAESARLDEIALHVDDDQRSGARIEIELVWLREHPGKTHGDSDSSICRCVRHARAERKARRAEERVAECNERRYRPAELRAVDQPDEREDRPGERPDRGAA